MANIGTPDAQIVLLKAPYLRYEQIILAKNFREYLESILFSAKVLRMGVQKMPYLKTYELQTGTQECHGHSMNFIGANRRFDWIESSLVFDFDKSDKHLTIYDSYNTECTARTIKSLEFANISEKHSATNTLKYDTSNDLQKDLLYKQFVAWHRNDCSNAPLTDFACHPIAQELKNETDYFGDDSDEKVYVDLRDSRGYVEMIQS